jgi:GMP synthase-like glutamine amidotransferase
MVIGLLQCDHVPEELQPTYGDYDQMFRSLFLPLAPDWEFKVYDVVNGHFPEKPEECDGYMATGSKSSVYDNEEWIHRSKSLIRELYQKSIKYTGVCFGHQLLAEALNGKVEKSLEYGWNVGVHQFSFTRQQSWMEPFQEQANLLMMCQDQVVKLPENSTILASLPTCPVSMFQTGETALGIQAHPEFPASYDGELINRRTERIGKDKAERALLSLQHNTLNSELIARWIINFMRS